MSLKGDHKGSVTLQSELGWYPSLNLNGYTLFLDGRLLYNTTHGATILGKGSITSNNNTIDIGFGGHSKYGFRIDSTIRDNGHKVGLRVSGPGRGAYIEMSGAEANTFTGDVELSNFVTLRLQKRDGLVSIKGNVFVNSHSQLIFDTSHQLSRSSVVTLNNGSLYFNSANGVYQRSKQLTVDNSGVLLFGSTQNVNFLNKLYLDNLLIRSGGELIVRNWKEGRDFIFVKKTSKNLADALKKMKFDGYDPRRIQLEDYDDEYWEVKGAPEPATYGAGLMLGVLGLVRYRRRQKQPSVKRSPN